jgi:hypothetical protein
MNVAANMTNIIPSTSVPVIGPIPNGCTKRNMMVKILSIIIAVTCKINTEIIYTSIIITDAAQEQQN